jgi:hypothetical protein
MRYNDLTTVTSIELEEIAVRDTETDEEKTAWQVNHDNLERPCRGDSPEEALKVFAEALSSDDKKYAIDLSDLESNEDDVGMMDEV